MSADIPPLAAASPSATARPDLWARLYDYWTSYAAGLTVMGIVAAGIAALAFAFFFVLAVLGLLAVTGALKWVLIIALVAVPVGIYVHRNYEPPAPPLPPLRRRMAGIYGDACYAALGDVEAMGLLPNPNGFGPSVYLGEFLNWFTPVDESWQRTNYHVGYTDENNVLTIGPAGSGKFTTAIAPTLLVSDESMVVLDPKGEAFAVTARHRQQQRGQQVVAINPFNLFGDMLGLADPLTAQFNPLAKLDPHDPTFTAQIDALAAAMILPEGTDPHWSNRARDLVACLMAHVCSDPEEHAAGNNHLPRVRQLLGLPRIDLAAYMENARGNPVARVANLAGGFNDPESKETGAVISTALGQTSFLDNPMLARFLSRSTFDFADLRREAMTVYLMLPPNELKTYYRFARLLVQSCISALSVEPKANDRRVLLLLDELAQLQRMDSLESAIALLRGYRVRVWSIFQDLNQMEDIYGKRWESFISNAGVVQVFTTNDDKTAKYFSAKAGNCTVEAESLSTSTSVGHSSGGQQGGSATSNTTTSRSTNLTGVPFLTPQDFYALPKWQSVMFVAGSRDPVPAYKQPYWEQPAFNGTWLPNPFHNPEGFRLAFLQGHVLTAAPQADDRARPLLPAPRRAA